MLEKITRLENVLENHDRLLILPHNDPDPDAIASAEALCYLVSNKFGIEARIRFQGIIGRAENKALLRYMKYPIKKLDQDEIQPNIPIALVDTQPGTGNNPLQKGITAKIVIDHHSSRGDITNVEYIDLRPEVGASATILTDYLKAAALEIPSTLATALFYGIKTDTMGLGRNASPEDKAAYLFLQPKVDVDELVQIEQAQVPLTYFKSLSNAIQAARVYDDDLVISYIGRMKYPDLGAEIADLLMRLKGVKLVLCMGVFQGEFIISVRSRSPDIAAGKFARHMIGDLGSAGGHGTMAGGQIKLDKYNPNLLSEMLINKALLGIKGDDTLVGTSII